MSRAARAIGALLVGWAMVIANHLFGVHWIYTLVRAAVWNGSVERALLLANYFNATTVAVQTFYETGLVAATIAAGIVYLLRGRARRAVAEGRPDPLAVLRALPWQPFVSVLLTMPTAIISALWTWSAARAQFELFWGPNVGMGTDPTLFAPAAAVLLLAQLTVAHVTWRALVAPLERRDPAKTIAEGLSFRAVAVTFETIAVIIGLVAISLVWGAIASSIPGDLLSNRLFVGSTVGYLALLIGGAAMFRHVSTIAIGLDGVYIRGSARARFFSFNEIDGARTKGTDLDLLHGNRVVIRLQLHGADAERGLALVERIRQAIALAKAHQHAPAVSFVRSASPTAMIRAASGAGSYRQAAGPSRDELWQVLESPAVDAAGRKAAAIALARDGSAEERVRLRVVGEGCAEPSVRARIEELLDETDEPRLRART